MIPQRLDAFENGLPYVGPTREQWLITVAVLLRPWFSARGYEIPLRIRLGVGALSFTQKTIGACFLQRDAHGFQHITISPFIDDPILVAAVITHELIHAILPQDELHGPRFRTAARALGFAGTGVAVEPGPDLRAELERITRRAGPYPHKAVVF